uniref:Uncharacterized protein n=1 Tax=Opuntia streptacantha TaxID=393608 RepID=A0A7C9EXS8_OPUST
MEISSAISERWRSLTLASFMGCILFIYIITLNNPTINLVISSSSVVTLSTMEEQPQSLSSAIVVTETEQVSPTIAQKEIKQRANRIGKKCDINDGKWVHKPEGKPIYYDSDCPFLEEKMNCRSNGRPDFEYHNWVWEPRDCDFVQFNGTDMLEKLRGKRMIVVGDSMNRNQWESLACLLYSAVDPAQVEGLEVKSRYRKLFRAKDYDFTLEFDFSPFLVKFNNDHESGSKVLQLDKISATSDNWLDADVMLFNTGHWWVHLGKFKTKGWIDTQYVGADTYSLEEAASM